MWCGVLLVVLVYLRFVPNNCSSHYHVKYEFHSYSHRSDRTRTGEKCEFWHRFGDHCDPLFDIWINGKNGCSIMSKHIPHVNNKKLITFVYSSSDYTKCDLSHIKMRVVVKDHDVLSRHDLIESFYGSILSNNLEGFKQSGYLKGKHSTGASIQYSISVRCEEYYYGNTCDVYCQPSVSYRCNKNGKKVCTLKCGLNQQCIRRRNMHFKCACKAGWEGNLCNIKQYTTQRNQFNVKSKKALPSISTTNVKHSTVLSTISSIPVLNTTNVKLSTTIKPEVNIGKLTTKTHTTKKAAATTTHYTQNQQTTEVIHRRKALSTTVKPELYIGKRTTKDHTTKKAVATTTYYTQNQQTTEVVHRRKALSTTVKPELYIGNITTTNDATKELEVKTINYTQNQRTVKVIRGQKAFLLKGRRAPLTANNFSYFWIIGGVVLLLCIGLITMWFIMKRKVKYHIEPITSVVFRKANSVLLFSKRSHNNSKRTCDANVSIGVGKYTRFSGDNEDKDGYSQLQSNLQGKYKPVSPYKHNKL